MLHHSPSNPATQRDRDFLRVCRRLLALTTRTDLTVAELAEMAADSPAPSYYLSFDYARRMLSERRRGVKTVRNPTPSHTSLLSPRRQSPAERRRAEIAAKVADLMVRSPGLKEADALTRVLAGPASSFFLAPDTARRLFSHLRRPHRRPPHHPQFQIANS